MSRLLCCCVAGSRRQHTPVVVGLDDMSTPSTYAVGYVDEIFNPSIYRDRTTRRIQPIQAKPKEIRYGD
jgi:hypothetical protein